MEAEAKAVEYKARLFALIYPEKQSQGAYEKDRAYDLHLDLKNSALAKSILSQQNTPETQEIIAIIKFYFDYFTPHYVEDFRENIAAFLVGLGYFDVEFLSRLNPWFRLFFVLNKSNIGLDTLQKWMFDAGFDEPFSEAAAKELSDRLKQPNQDLGYGVEASIIKLIFAERACFINVRADEEVIAPFISKLLNSIKPPLGVAEATEIWSDEEHQTIVPTLVADTLLDYVLEIPDDKIVLTHFTSDNQVYGFYHSDDAMMHMYIVMRNIDCFLSHMNRPERVFRLKQVVEEADFYILAEPDKFKSLAKKLRFEFHDAETEANFQGKDYDMPPSLSTLRFHGIQKNELKLGSTPVVDKFKQKELHVRPNELKESVKATFNHQQEMEPQKQDTLLRWLVEFYLDMPRVMKLTLIGFILVTLVLIGIEWVVKIH